MTSPEIPTRLVVTKDFNVLDFNRVDYIRGAYHYTEYSSPTEYRVGPRGIDKKVVFEEEIGIPVIKVSVGVGAGGRWYNMRKIRNYGIRKNEEDDAFDIFWVEEKVKPLRDSWYFDGLAWNMQHEYETGLDFIGEIKKAFWERFSGWDIFEDKYDSFKKIMFIRSGSLDKAVSWSIWPNEFDISVGEVCEVANEEGFDYNVFAVGKKIYWAHDFSGVWYPTATRETHYGMQDSQKKSRLLQESFEVLDYYLGETK
jgi:hypothetical protein